MRNWRYPCLLAADADPPQIDIVAPDAAHNPRGAILDRGAPVVPAGLHGVTDEDPLAVHPERLDPRVELALLGATLLDGFVDGIQFSVRPGDERYPLPL